MEFRPQGGAKKIIAGCVIGALVSVVIAFILMFMITKFDIGVFGLTGKNKPISEILSKAAMNTYLVQHISASGKGVSADGAGQVVSSIITLPITLWIVIPILALFIGGYIADKISGRVDRRYILSPAFFSAVLYTVVFAALTCFVKSYVNGNFFPVISGTSIAIPEIVHKPVWQSALIFAGLLSLIFTYFGHLVATHRRHITDDSEKGKWWICLKSNLHVMYVFYFIIQFLLIPNLSGNNQISLADRYKIIQMMPTVTGIAYGMIFGFDATADVKSTFKLRSEAYRPLSIKAGVLNGVVQNDDNRKSDKKFSSAIKISICAFGALLTFISGLLAVRWGVRGGFVPVGLRITIVYGIVLMITYAFSSVFLRYSDALSSTNVYIGLVLNKSMVIYALMVFAASMIGAQIGRFKKVI